MRYRLNTYVHAVELDGNSRRTGREATFGPGDTLPDWALTSISNPDVWDGQAPPRPAKPEPVATPGPAADQSEVARLRARVAELEAAAAPSADQTPGGDDGSEPASATVIPPRGGPGSGAPEWRDYARSRGVEVGDDASRDDVIAALEAAGKPTK